MWHGGEPLAIGRSRLVELLEPFEPLRVTGHVQHKVQTGATLITDEWCELFERYGVGVGVSIDGPRSTSHHRVDRGGRPMFDRIEAGIVLDRAPDLAYVQEFMVGLQRCKATCEFFAYCQGAHAGNRYFGAKVTTKTESLPRSSHPRLSPLCGRWGEWARWD